MKILTKSCKKVYTVSQNQKSNGWILEIASDKDNFTKYIKGQVYLTVVSPGEQKGFHNHKIKTNHITCIKGFLTVGIYDGKKIHNFKIGEDNFKTILIPPNFPLALFNRGTEDAYVINYCFPAYDPQVKEQEEISMDWDKK